MGQKWPSWDGASCHLTEPASDGENEWMRTVTWLLITTILFHFPVVLLENPNLYPPTSQKKTPKVRSVGLFPIERQELTTSESRLQFPTVTTLEIVKYSHQATLYQVPGKKLSFASRTKVHILHSKQEIKEQRARGSLYQPLCSQQTLLQQQTGWLWLPAC